MNKEELDILLLKCKTIEEFKTIFIKDFVPSPSDNQFSEMTYHIDQDILAECFWLGRKDLIRKEKLKRIIDAK